METESHTTAVGVWKIIFAWLGVGVSNFSLQASMTFLALGLTIIFTVLQIHKIWRDIARDKRMEKLEAKLRQEE